MILHHIFVVLIALNVKLSATDSFSAEVKLQNEPWIMLPQLYDYDDFDDCQRRNPSFRYSVVKAHIVENTSSVMWQHITQHSNDPRHYQRNALEIGICLDRCKWSSNAEMSIEQLAGACAVDRVWTNYQLKSIPETLVSISTDDYDQPVGTLEMIFCLTVLSIVLLKVTCTIIDFQSIHTESMIVKAFSLSENIRKLGSLNSRSRQDLLFLDGIRVLTMLTIVLCHASIPMIRMPLKNPEKMEQQFCKIWFPIAMAGNTYLVHIFFVIGGVVLAVNFMDHIKAHPQFKMWYLMDRILNRLIRILPVYAFVIFFQVSWYKRLKNGPIAERYQDHCMENWWTNLLFVNNYIQANKPCLQFTWYLGADFQLFLVGTIILMFIWRFPKFINALICFMVIFALVVPAAVIYFNNLDATVMMIVRYVIDEIRNLDYYLKVYVTFESNAGNYFFGMVTGIVYHHFVEHGKKLESIKHFNAMFLSAVAFFVILNILTMCLPLDHPAEPSLILALYGSLLKASWGFLACFLIFYLTFRPRNMLASILQHPIMLVASKLSYCVYVVQYTVVYVIYRNITFPLMSSVFTMIFLTSSILFVTLIMGLLLHVCIEMPFMTLCKPLLALKRSN